MTVRLNRLEENLDPFLDAMSGEIGPTLRKLVERHEHLLPQPWTFQDLTYCMAAIIGRYVADLSHGAENILGQHSGATMAANTCGCVIECLGDPEEKTEAVKTLRKILDFSEENR